MQDSNKLNQLLKKAGKYHPHYGDRLATHLPMVLSALNGLGATDEKLETMFNRSINGLEYLDESFDTTNINEISQYLGDSDKYKSYLKYFIKQIDSLGFKTVVRNSLPILLPGIAASAFHALIRLAYAVEENNNNEVAISLAYWCTEFQAFDLCNETTNDTLEKTLEKLSPIGVNHTFSPGIIVDRMDEIGELLKKEKCVFQPDVINFTDIRKLCLNVFYAQDDFTLLHTVTACHAFSTIIPYIENMNDALRELWKAILVAYLSTGLRCELTNIEQPASHCDFNPLILKALTSNDSHVIKLVYTCLNEHSKYNDSLYFMIAERAVLNDCS